MKKEGNILFFANGCNKKRINKLVKNYIADFVEKIKIRKENSRCLSKPYFFEMNGSFCTVLGFSIDGITVIHSVDIPKLIREGASP